MAIKPLLIHALFLLFIVQIAGAINIHEIMYNPEGDDNNREFVEVYHTPNTDLTGYIIADRKSNDTLILLKKSNSSFSLIVEEGFDYAGLDCSIYSAGAAIGNSLGENDSVFLFDKNNTLLDSVLIDPSLANGNNKSMELLNTTWRESNELGGSPCKPNQLVEYNATLNDSMPDQGVTLNNETNNTTNELNPEISKGPNNESINVPINGPINESINESNANKTLVLNIAPASNNRFNKSEAKSDNNSVNYTLGINEICNVSMDIYLEKNVFLENETIRFGFVLSNKSFPYTIEYWVEDLFGNILKQKINTSNTNTKSYSPNLDEDDKGLLIKSNLLVFCNNQSYMDSAQALVFVKKINVRKESESWINFTINGNKTKFGGNVIVNLNIYKGDTTKKTIDIWFGEPRISEITRVNVEDKFSFIELSVSIHIESDCDQALSPGEYPLFVEGLGIKKVHNVSVESSQCRIKSASNQSELNSESSNKTDSKTNTKSGIQYELVEYPEQMNISFKNFKIKLNITNFDAKDHTIAVWSYVYRGSKSYSGERESNLNSFVLSANFSKLIELENNINITKAGEYNLKVKINKDDQATSKEITKTVIFVEPLNSSEINKLNDEDSIGLLGENITSNDSDDSTKESTKNKEVDQEISTNSIAFENNNEKKETTSALKKTRFVQEAGCIAYESKNTQTQKKTLYFILALVAVVFAILVFKR